jgi:hypothetical protein
VCWSKKKRKGKEKMRYVDYFTDPESACIYHKWAAGTPIVVFVILYGLVQVVKLNLNMLYLLSIYVAASYSAWCWGKSVKRQNEL